MWLLPLYDIYYFHLFGNHKKKGKKKLHVSAQDFLKLLTKYSILFLNYELFQEHSTFKYKKAKCSSSAVRKAQVWMWDWPLPCTVTFSSLLSNLQVFHLNGCQWGLNGMIWAKQLRDNYCSINISWIVLLSTTDFISQRDIYEVDILSRLKNAWME